MNAKGRGSYEGKKKHGKSETPKPSGRRSFSGRSAEKQGSRFPGIQSQKSSASVYLLLMPSNSHMNRNYQKGSRFEREIVKILKENGISASRVPTSGIGGLGDVIISVGEKKYIAGCKVRKKLPNWLLSDLERFDFVFFKENWGKIFCMMPLEKLLYFLKKEV